MADTTTPSPTKPAAAAPQTVLLEMERDYWPRQRPKNLPEDVEHRVRVGERVELDADEAIDVIERGIGKRVRREDALKA